MKKIAVIGAGTMGNGIAHVFAQNSFNVEFVDIKKEFVDKGLATIEKNLDRQIKKEKITEKDKIDTLNRITTKIGIADISNDTDLVIEAVVEDKDIKLSIFKELQHIVKAESIFASNTSSISITELGIASRPDKFIGMHFMNPVPMMQLVEIIRGYSTSDETFNTIKDLTLKIEKTPVEVQDYPGFVSNRILMPMINEAIYALYENVASAEDIDTVMKLGMAHPMGPLTLADFIGLDVCLAIMNVLYDGFNDSKYRPCPLLKKMVAANKLGRKTNEGFYKYE
ncbi:MAG: 3-hydroxybutyryl-CoA dehydrogenase [Ignavibacteriales bacterium]|nr:3-hydroxybutyryl-CoA dehydrogenase [Ignavibacteriales bacterium]MCB9209839.1 3-hydroxybutyryl-CoA dehydrogenase [Ignavibacteriales bacterium]MCB9218996.1 3-hydroxybutyryl-CoA dehydrogenase [Ignavibacteriales bacterium]